MTGRHRYIITVCDALAFHDFLRNATASFAVRGIAPISEIAAALRVEFVAGEDLDYWRTLILRQFDRDEIVTLTELNYPDHWPEPHQLRRRPAA